MGRSVNSGCGGFLGENLLCLLVLQSWDPHTSKWMDLLIVKDRSHLGGVRVWEGEVSLEAGGLEATEIMDLLWEKQFLIFTSGPTLLMKNSFA